MPNGKIVLNGQNLKISDIEALANDPTCSVEIDQNALEKVKKGNQFLKDHLKDKVIYGINTGFGPMASHIIGDSQLLELQENLVRSHAVGMGKPIKNSFVLAMMVVRLNSLVKGYSGVTAELLQHLQEFINQRIIPVVPEHGAVGTSGDLVQLAHVALALIGEGEVFYENQRQPVVDVLRKLNINPYKLQIKEGLALINGTSAMTAIGALLCIQAERLVALEIHNGAYALELVNAFKDSMASRLHELRPHTGQNYVASKLTELLRTSKMLQDRAILKGSKKDIDDVYQIEGEVQDVYSFRCIPQIVGPVVESLAKTKQVIEIEMNSVTDNPVIDWENEDFLHGGNFHGDYIAWAVDQLKMTLVKLSMLSERRINFFLNNKINRRFPPFLNLKKPGLTLGLQGLQFVATSTTAQNQTLAFPQYVHSIPTNADNQDVVSMGTDAALIAHRVLDNSFVVAAIEMVVLAQATDVNGAREKLSKSSQKLFAHIRDIIPKVVEDRTLSGDLEKLLTAIKIDSGFDLRD